MNTAPDIAVIAVTPAGIALGEKIAGQLSASLHIPEKHIHLCPDATPYLELTDAFRELFTHKKGIVAVMAQGIVTRKIAPLVESKYSDPAVVVCDEVGRFAISALSGHEGGANELAYLVSSITGAEPVITTASEANKRYTAGVGCRRGVSAADIIHALHEGCKAAGVSISDIRSISSAWLKCDEQGLLDAAKELNVYLRFIPESYLSNPVYRITPSLAEEKIGVPAVAEPCALLSARNPKLVLPKTVYGNVTVAIAEELIG